jgi:hypothetical protein
MRKHIGLDQIVFVAAKLLKVKTPTSAALELAATKPATASV